MAVAGAAKSAASSVLLPLNAPVRTSTQHTPCVENGFVPDTVPRVRRNTAETIVAPSGREDVSNETIALYCRSPLSSPAISADTPAHEGCAVPPAPLVSMDSSTQPSSAAIETKVACCADAGVGVGVGVAVGGGASL